MDGFVLSECICIDSTFILQKKILAISADADCQFLHHHVVARALFKPFVTGRTFNFMSSSVHNIIPLLFTIFVSATYKTFTDRMQLSIINLRRDSGWTFRFSIAFMF